MAHPFNDGKRYTQEELDTIKRMHSLGFSFERIAGELQRSPKAVRWQASMKIGLRTGKHKTVDSPAKKEESPENGSMEELIVETRLIRALLADIGISLEDIAKSNREILEEE